MKIIIIGAGISGLSLAFFLQQKGHDITVLERDNVFESERQGFSLTMQSNTLKIFEEYNLLDEIYSLGNRSKRQIFYDHFGNILYENNNNDNDRFNYPLPRQEIRRVFYSKLKENTVIFNVKVIDVIGNRVITELEEYSGDYIIACVGLNSIIRNKYIPEIKLNDLALCNVYGITDLTLLEEKDRIIIQKYRF